MAKAINKAKYIDILRIIYKYSNFDINKAEILVKYTSHQMMMHKIDPIYIDKLQYDTRIALKDEYNYEIVLRQLHKIYTHFEVIEIKTTVFDVLSSGYYY